MSADRDYTIYVKEQGKFIQKENHSAYRCIAQMIEDENSGIIDLPEDIEAKNKESFETAMEGRMEYWYTKEGYVLDFLENIDKFDLKDKYLVPYKDDNDNFIVEANDFLEICEKYRDLPREDVLISYQVTY